jgi:protocatechuate 3,4-dioxygenase beta subunit
MKRIPYVLLAAGLLLYLVAPLAMARDDEFNEAVQQTEEQWKAVRTTMQEGKGKFDDFQKKFKEYHDAVFSDSPEKGIELAQKLFNLDKNQTKMAQDKLDQLRNMFNELENAGLTKKLKTASEYLDKADKFAGEAENIWEFTKKFDPEHAKDNPTYGLRLIGTLLTESASKMEKIPLVGQILGAWIKAYGEVAGDFANALDRLTKKIDEFRGGSLCGQSGKRQDQQAAFKEAGGSGCLTYFATGIFPRMRGEVYEGNNDYFLFDPATKRGYFANKSNAGKVYRWHERLLERRALDPDWLASRANGLKAEVEAKAREYSRLFAGWKDKSDPGWLIIEDRNLYQDAYFYGRLDEETFVANYVLSDTHHNAIEAIIKEYEKYVLLAGTVYEDEDDNVRRSSGAVVELTLNGKVYKQTTDADGKYEIIMEGKAGDAVGEKVTKEGFEPLNQQGRIPQKVTTGNVYTLTKGGAKQVVISGSVSFKEDKDKQAQPLGGATVTAAAAQAAGLGSATSGGDGSYSLTVQVEMGVEVTCTATKDGNSGAASVTVTGEAHAGVDIVITGTAADTSALGVGWIINVTVLDDNGKPLPSAVVSCTHNVAAATTGADGTTTVGPIPVPKNWEEEPFAVTLTPSIVAQGGIKVGGTAASVTYEGKTPSAATLTIPVIIPTAVTASGTVTDANGVSIDGAVVTGGGQAVTVAAGGAFSIGPFMLVKDSSITLMATKTDGANTWGGAPVTITFDGTNKTISGVTIVLDIETETDVTISGFVHDLDGKGLPNATVTVPSGGSAVTDGSGRYTLPAFLHKLGTSVTISASLTDHRGTPVGGSTNCTPMADATTAPTIVLQVQQEDVYDVTISGTVQDEQGAGISGAVVTGGGSSTTTDASGGFALPPIELAANESAAVSATYTDGSTQLAGGPVTVTFNGVNTDIGGVVITLKKSTTPVTVTGTVNSTDGNPVKGASVTGGGATTTTDAGGAFSLGPIDHELGTPLPLSASVVLPDGGSAGGNTTVTPTSGSVSTSIAIDMSAGSDDDSDIDDDIDDVEDDIDGEVDYDALLMEFSMVVGELDGIAADFNGLADFFDQLLRELREEACNSGDVSYALTTSASLEQLYSLSLTSLYGVYGEVIAAQAADPANRSLGNVESEFMRCINREGTIEGRRSGMLSAYGVYQCDSDQASTESGDKADDEADPEDVEGGVEICGDGIDNDGDGEIDECDAGCCDKNVQVTVSDCGFAADDIFLVAVDGGDVGVTPKGAANTFNVELSPGDHSITVTCLDDGGDPLGSDIGTACVTVVVFGENQAIAGAEMGIAYGGSQTIVFYVSEGPASAKIYRKFDGSSLRGLE